MHITCGEKSREDWHSGKEHAAHLGHHQYHTGDRWGSYFDSMSLSQNVGCYTKSDTSCTANDITRQVQEHVFGKDVRRMSDQSRLCRKKSTPLVISRAFSVVFSFTCFRISVQHSKCLSLRSTTTAKINGGVYNLHPFGGAEYQTTPNPLSTPIVFTLPVFFISLNHVACSVSYSYYHLMVDLLSSNSKTVRVFCIF
jgi:hypothetical protein